jgi:hypothetical protein
VDGAVDGGGLDGGGLDGATDEAVVTSAGGVDDGEFEVADDMSVDELF